MTQVFATTRDETNFAVEIRNGLRPQNVGGFVINNNGFLIATNTIGGASGVARLDSTGRWTIVSDLEVKRDVKSSSNLLEKTLSLNPVNFYYKNQDLEQLPHEFIGFIAQEVEQILPHLVVGENPKTLDYNGLAPVIVGAIKEMKQYYDEKIANLEMQIGELKKTQ
jgi:Chaperone of endosialidase